MASGVEEAKRRKAAIVGVLFAVAEACDEGIEGLVGSSVLKPAMVMVVTVCCDSIDMQASSTGRAWKTERNAPDWFSQYVIPPFTK